MEPLVSWICDVLAAGVNPEVLAAAVRSLTILLRKHEARSLFASHGGVPAMPAHLQSYAINRSVVGVRPERDGRSPPPPHCFSAMPLTH